MRGPFSVSGFIRLQGRLEGFGAVCRHAASGTMTPRGDSYPGSGHGCLGVPRLAFRLPGSASRLQGAFGVVRIVPHPHRWCRAYREAEPCPVNEFRACPASYGHSTMFRCARSRALQHPSTCSGIRVHSDGDRALERLRIGL